VLDAFRFGWFVVRTFLGVIALFVRVCRVLGSRQGSFDVSG
jgi:hypothetical protein